MEFTGIFKPYFFTPFRNTQVSLWQVAVADMGHSNSMMVLIGVTVQHKSTWVLFPLFQIRQLSFKITPSRADWVSYLFRSHFSLVSTALPKSLVSLGWIWSRHFLWRPHWAMWSTVNFSASTYGLGDQLWHMPLQGGVAEATLLRSLNRLFC